MMNEKALLRKISLNGSRSLDWLSDQPYMGEEALCLLLQ